jgi:hypothetical protein
MRALAAIALLGLLPASRATAQAPVRTVLVMSDCEVPWVSATEVLPRLEVELEAAGLDRYVALSRHVPPDGEWVRATVPGCEGDAVSLTAVDARFRGLTRRVDLADVPDEARARTVALLLADLAARRFAEPIAPAPAPATPSPSPEPNDEPAPSRLSASLLLEAHYVPTAADALSGPYLGGELVLTRGVRATAGLSALFSSADHPLGRVDVVVARAHGALELYAAGLDPWLVAGGVEVAGGFADASAARQRSAGIAAHDAFHGLAQTAVRARLGIPLFDTAGFLVELGFAWAWRGFTLYADDRLLTGVERATFYLRAGVRIF